MLVHFEQPPEDFLSVLSNSFTIKGGSLYENFSHDLSFSRFKARHLDVIVQDTSLLICKYFN